MFDAKSLLDSIMRGQSAGQGARDAGGGAPGSLGDLLGGLLQGGNNPRADAVDDTPNASRAAPAGATTSGRGGLQDILGDLQNRLGTSGTGGTGGIADILKQVLGQATAGTREGADRLGQSTGASDMLRNIANSPNSAELLAKLKQMVTDNPMALGGALGGLGGVLLGTQTGRSLAGSAAKLGAAALIGGLAYKAYQNYQAGRPLITGATSAEPAPDGSGFEPAAVTQDDATLYIKAMVAAAAADGNIDADEQAHILGNLNKQGLDAEAEAFLADAMNAPPSVQELSAGVKSVEHGVQVYTAARLAIDPDTEGERAFLSKLAAALGIDAALASHVEATTAAAANTAAAATR